MNAYEANNLPGLFYDAAAARTPYKLSLGPTVLTAKAQASAGSVKVTATADDNAYGTSGVGRPAAQKVTAGRIFVGKAPWAGGTSKAMTVQGSGTSVDPDHHRGPGREEGSRLRPGPGRGRQLGSGRGSLDPGRLSHVGWLTSNSSG